MYVNKGQKIRVKRFSFTNSSGGTGMSDWQFDPHFKGVAELIVTKEWMDDETGQRIIGKPTSKDLKDYLAKVSKDNIVYVSEFDVQKIISEGAFKPGGKYIGIISKQPKRMVKCQKCKGTGDMSDTKTGITCDKCHGSGKLYIDPGEKQRDDIWEMSTVAGVAGFNASMGTNKKGIKHNFPIKEENDEVILKNFKKDIKTVSHEYLSELIDDYMEEYPHLESQFQKITGQKKSPTLWKLPKDPGDPKIKEMKTFKRILNEIDLSTKDKTLTNFLTQVSQTGELGKQFGANYKPETFMDWLRSKVENYGLSVSDKYLNAMESNIKNKTPNQAQMYVYNALLKGSGLGLTETVKKRKKNVNSNATTDTNQ